MAQSAEVMSHWHVLIEDFNTSALEFYARVERELKDRQIPELETERVDWHEGGVLSAKREYLRVSRGRLTYDICGAPYGKSYFFSSWMAVQPPDFAALYGCGALIGAFLVFLITVANAGLVKGTFIFLILTGIAWWVVRLMIASGSTGLEDTISAMPVIGPLYRLLFSPVTYYAQDTRLMFQESVHRTVTQAIAEIRTAQGLRALTPEELRPTMRDLLH